MPTTMHFQDALPGKVKQRSPLFTLYKMNGYIFFQGREQFKKSLVLVLARGIALLSIILHVYVFINNLCFEGGDFKET